MNMRLADRAAQVLNERAQVAFDPAWLFDRGPRMYVGWVVAVGERYEEGGQAA